MKSTSTPALPSFPAWTRAGAVLSLAVTLVLTATAQDRRPEGGRGRDGGPPRMNPMFAALDANGDGTIDAAELANASVALKKLDRNGDGKLTDDEVRPAFGGRGGPGGPGGPGGGQGAGNADEVVARMLQFDKNADGKLAKDELPERMVAMMERGDANKDGFLTRDELVALAQAQMQRGATGGDRDGGRPKGGDERR